MSTEDLSFYPGHSPASSPRPCSTSPCDPQLGLLSPEHSPLRFSVVRADSDQHFHHHQPECDMVDQSSMDSGYSTNFSQDPVQKQNFKFMAPCGVPPRRIEPSPRKISSSSIASSTSSTSSSSNTSPKSSSNFRIFNSLSSGSMESVMDDDYLELFEMEALDDNAQLPSDICNLISGNIMSTRTTPEVKRPLARRSLSLNENETNRAKTNLFSILPRTPEVLRPVLENLTPYSSRIDGRSFKRPEPPTENFIQSKRYRSDDKENVMNINDAIKLPPIRKSISMNDATTIMNALAKCKFYFEAFLKFEFFHL